MEIVLKNVGYRYKNKKILEHINLRIADNHITGITGQYKTILSELLDAQTMATTGSIRVGEDLISKESLKKVRKDVSLIRQNYQDQFFTCNIKEEMLFLLERLNCQPKMLTQKMEQALVMVGLKKDYLNKNIETLSSGEKKILQVAVSLLYNPSIIIFDEPFVELDYLNQKKLIKLIKVLKDKYKKNIIITSSDSNLLYELTDDIVILSRGTIIAADSTSKVYQNVDFLKENEIEIPYLVEFTSLAKQKKVKLSFHRDIRDLIKDVYKHV